MVQNVTSLGREHLHLLKLHGPIMPIWVPVVSL
jgi:hypothetical protein